MCCIVGTPEGSVDTEENPNREAAQHRTNCGKSRTNATGSPRRSPPCSGRRPERVGDLRDRLVRQGGGLVTIDGTEVTCGCFIVFASRTARRSLREISKETAVVSLSFLASAQHSRDPHLLRGQHGRIAVAFGMGHARRRPRQFFATLRPGEEIKMAVYKAILRFLHCVWVPENCGEAGRHKPFSADQNPGFCPPDDATVGQETIAPGTCNDAPCLMPARRL